MFITRNSSGFDSASTTRNVSMVRELHEVTSLRLQVSQVMILTPYSLTAVLRPWKEHLQVTRITTLQVSPPSVPAFWPTSASLSLPKIIISNGHSSEICRKGSITDRERCGGP
jgi:hypothetical protein